MSIDNITTNPKISTCYPYNGGYCWYRLPCGICQRTNQICPLMSNGGWEISWTTETGETENAEG